MATRRKSSENGETDTNAGEAKPFFSGFPQAGFRLLRQLKKNNNREWFNKHKAEYQENVEEPMKALVHSVAEDCQARGVPLYAKEKNPVMRVYRDIRFSRDKTPYKTHIAAELRRSFTRSQTMLYLHFAPERSFAAAGVWQPDRTLLQAWRTALINKPEEIEEVAAKLKRRKLSLDFEQSLSSMPRGFQNYTALPVARFLKLTSFVLSRDIEGEDCHTSNLVSKVVSFALDAKPLLEYGWKVEETLPRSFPE